MARRIQRLTVEHAITVAVAAACAGLALAEGGFPPTAFAASALVVWVVVVLGLATGLLPRAEPPRAALAAGFCLAGLTAWTALSMTWASDNGRAFEDAVRALLYLGTFVFVVAGARRGGAGPWLTGLAVGTGIVAAIALLARFEPSWFGNPDADLVADLPAAAGRLTYPIGYWNGLAALMGAGLVLFGWLAATGRTRHGRAAALGVLPVVVLALWMTNSRGGLIAGLVAYALLVAIGPARTGLVANLALGGLASGVLIGAVELRDELLIDPVDPAAAGQGDEMLVLTLVVATVAYGVRYALDRRFGALSIPARVGRIAIVTALIAAVVAIVAADPVQRWEDFKEPPQAEDVADGVGLLRAGGSGRYQFWETAIDAFGSAPLAGIGASDYQPYWLENRELAIDATRAHSAFFESLAELGIVGFLLLVGFFAAPAAATVIRLRRRRAAPQTGVALGVLTVGFLAAAVDWTWDLPAVFVPTVAAAALLAGAATVRARKGEPEGPGQILGTARSRRRFAAGVTVLLVAWASICASAMLLLSDNRLEASRDQFAAGETEQAIKTVRDAINIQPWAAEPRTQLALLYDEAGDLEAAREALDEAIERSPRNYQLYLLKVRMDVEAGDFESARRALEKAAELNPLDPEIRKLEEQSG